MGNHVQLLMINQQDKLGVCPFEHKCCKCVKVHVSNTAALLLTELLSWSFPAAEDPVSQRRSQADPLKRVLLTTQMKVRTHPCLCDFQFTVQCLTAVLSFILTGLKRHIVHFAVLFMLSLFFTEPVCCYKCAKERTVSDWRAKYRQLVWLQGQHAESAGCQSSAWGEPLCRTGWDQQLLWSGPVRVHTSLMWHMLLKYSN